MKRDLFVFAGQSNMMGAAVYPPKIEIHMDKSYEYKHKPKRFGAERGAFVSAGYPVGEFSYKDLSCAYAQGNTDANGNSKLDNYKENTYFVASLSSMTDLAAKREVPFAFFSESNATFGATLAPLLAMEWEKLGNASLYAHIAKGSVCIAHYMTDEMVREYGRRVSAYNRENGTSHRETVPDIDRMPGAADYFFTKCRDFFADAEASFPDDDTSERCFFWLQGEGDAGSSVIDYEFRLDVLWDALKTIGFTRFFCIRIDFFGDPAIDRVMEAQERFTEKHPDAYMLTRAASYFTYAGRDESDWFITPPAEEYRNCRDSFYGFPNQHINEKGFTVIAKHSAPNLQRVLREGKAPILEEENIKSLRIEDK